MIIEFVDYCFKTGAYPKGLEIIREHNLMNVILQTSPSKSDLKVHESSTVSQTENNPEFPIFVKTLIGKTSVLYVHALESIESIKQKIALSEGVPIDQQRIIFAGKLLDENEKTLNDLNIVRESTIHMILRMSGD